MPHHTLPAVRHRTLVGLLAAVFILLVPSIGIAQPPAPSKPAVSYDANLNLLIRWTYDMDRYPDTVFAVQGTVNGVPVDPIPVERFMHRDGNNLSVTLHDISPPVAFGVIVRIVALNSHGFSPYSPPSDPVEGLGHPAPPAPDGPPAVPTLNAPEISGSTVSISWDVTGTVIEFDVEAIAQSSGQTFNFTIPGDQRRLSVPGVPNGNFLVRIRSRNARGASDWSPYKQVLVGVTVGTGDLQVTLTWNSTADMDLHVLEPDGTHVYFGRRNGVTARLDRDDTDGFGPENIFVNRGAAAAGTYQVYIVHFSRNVPTTSTIAIRVHAGTPNERYALITRSTGAGNPSQRIDVATVNVLNGTISGVSSIGPAWSGLEAPQDVKLPVN
jgi:hypothetical protein